LHDAEDVFSSNQVDGLCDAQFDEHGRGMAIVEAPSNATHIHEVFVGAPFVNEGLLNKFNDLFCA
jgi:hypothetical protein